MLRFRPPTGSVDQWYLVQVNGSDVPATWRIEVLRAGGTIVRTEWHGTRLYLADSISPREPLAMVVHYPSGSGATYIRHPFRILVPEVDVPDSDNRPTTESSGQQAQSEHQFRIQAIPALDFGTYGKCAALWEIRKPLPRGQLSDGQFKALAAAIGAPEQERLADAARRPGDVERRAANAYIDGEVEDRRHLAWEAVFATPALEHYSIRQVIEPARLPLSGQEESGPSGQPSADGTNKADPGPGRLGSRGLKRDLLKQSADPAVLENLVKAYHTMAIDALAELKDDFGKPRMPFQIQFTYPTRLPSALRNRLAERLSKTDLPGPRLGLDEASAVAFFDLLSRIGQRTDLGIAALQAQAEARRNGQTLTDRVLVIDVGAGTTDVALIDMRIEDATPDRVGADKGRFWMLSPVVLASGGALTFGADRLTLELFRALKRRLSEVGVKDLETYWKDQDGDVSRTRWATFVELWTAAERIKEDVLGSYAGKDLTATVSLHGQQHDIGLRWETDVAPHADAFLRRLASLAAGIAKAGLSVIADRTDENASSPAPHVDRIVLSGQSFRSVYLREELEKFLRAVFRQDNYLNEDFALVAHLQNLKSATAFGAAFAASVADNEAHPNNDEVVADMRQGLDRFGIKVDALRSNLAAQFSTLLGGPGIGRQTIFERGTPLSREVAGSSPGGADTADIPRALVRSQKHAVWQTVTIQREDAEFVHSTLVRHEQGGDDSTITWGFFHVTGLEDLVKSRQDLYEASADLHATYEIDEDENVSMFLHVGPLPLELASGSEFGSLPKDALSSGTVPYDIFLNAGNQMQKTGKPLLTAGTALPAVCSVSAARATATLSAQVPGHDQPQHWTVQEKGHRWVSIDEEGRLRSHEFNPPIRCKNHDGTPESTLALLEQINAAESGRYAYRVDIEPAGQYDEITDPFSGVH
jgi:hypothetical protein